MRKLIAVAALTLAAPLAAKDSLGVFSDWGAFRDPSLPRCYAIAMPEDSRARRDFEPFATIGTCPRMFWRGHGYGCSNAFLFATLTKKGRRAPSSPAPS